MGNQPQTDLPRAESPVIDYETRLFTLLFGEPVSEYEMSKRVRAGLPVSVLGVLRGEGLTDSEINVALSRHLSNEHILREQHTLRSEESAGVVRVARILSLAQQTFDNRGKAVSWLRRNNKSAHGHAPLELLRSSEGADRVQEMLYQIDEGIYA